MEVYEKVEYSPEKFHVEYMNIQPQAFRIQAADRCHSFSRLRKNPKFRS